ncbi:hypothetical protein BLOT_003096 [Blomia tropicalis]|nr:hypothetical protein BLOT_003096 [Blomia tropicalis]
MNKEKNRSNGEMERNVKSGPNTMSIKSSQVIYMGRQLQSLCNKMFCTETVLNVTHVDRNCRPETDEFIWNVQYNSEVSCGQSCKWQMASSNLDKDDCGLLVCQQRSSVEFM